MVATILSVPPGTAVGTSLAGQLDSSVQLIRNLFLSHRSAREIIQTKNPQAKVGANPFVLGLPVLLQYFIDWLATRMRDRSFFNGIIGGCRNKRYSPVHRSTWS